MGLSLVTFSSNVYGEGDRPPPRRVSRPPTNPAATERRAPRRQAAPEAPPRYLTECPKNNIFNGNRIVITRNIAAPDDEDCFTLIGKSNVRISCDAGVQIRSQDGALGHGIATVRDSSGIVFSGCYFQGFLSGIKATNSDLEVRNNKFFDIRDPSVSLPILANRPAIQHTQEGVSYNPETERLEGGRRLSLTVIGNHFGKTEIFDDPRASGGPQIRIDLRAISMEGGKTDAVISDNQFCGHWMMSATGVDIARIPAHSEYVVSGGNNSWGGIPSGSRFARGLSDDEIREGIVFHALGFLDFQNQYNWGTNVVVSGDPSNPDSLQLDEFPQGEACRIMSVRVTY